MVGSSLVDIALLMIIFNNFILFSRLMTDLRSLIHDFNIRWYDKKTRVASRDDEGGIIEEYHKIIIILQHYT